MPEPSGLGAKSDVTIGRLILQIMSGFVTSNQLRFWRVNPNAILRDCARIRTISGISVAVSKFGMMAHLWTLDHMLVVTSTKRQQKTKCEPCSHDIPASACLVVNSHTLIGLAQLRIDRSVFTVLFRALTGSAGGLRRADLPRVGRVLCGRVAQKPQCPSVTRSFARMRYPVL
jgi:hypothetical protein